ncbi:unnamed protein product, partial [Brenthis ino]
MASYHMNIEQISNLLNEDEEEPFDESDYELGFGEHLPEQQNHNSDSKQSGTNSEDEEQGHLHFLNWFHYSQSETNNQEQANQMVQKFFKPMNKTKSSQDYFAFARSNDRKIKTKCGKCNKFMCNEHLTKV